MTGLPVHECQLLVGSEEHVCHDRTASVAWIGGHELQEHVSRVLAEIRQCKPHVLVICVESSPKSQKPANRDGMLREPPSYRSHSTTFPVREVAAYQLEV